MIELLIDNYDSGEHPIHVHGRRMYVMARGEEGSGPYSFIKYPMNTVDPILRDTITVAANSSIGQPMSQSSNKLFSFRFFNNLGAPSDFDVISNHGLPTAMLQ